MDEQSSTRRGARVVIVLGGLAAAGTLAFGVSRSGRFDPWRPGTIHTGTVSAAGCSIFYPNDADRTVTMGDPSTLGWSSVDDPPDNWTKVKRVSGGLTVIDDTHGVFRASDGTLAFRRAFCPAQE